MLSRNAILAGQQAKSLLSLAARCTATSAQANSSQPAAAAGATSGPPRTLVRLEPGKVRIGVVPEEWFQFFYKKTGVTGPYVFGTGFITYLVSKEWWVLEHEFYNGISLFIFCTVLIKKLGPPLAKYLDKEIDDYEKSLNDAKDGDRQDLEQNIESEKQLQVSNEGQLVLVDAKRENVSFQLEAEYRTRLMAVYEGVKKRLDYQVALTDIENRFVQKNLVDWVVRNVKSSVTPDQDKKNIDTCIAELGRLAKA